MKKKNKEIDNTLGLEYKPDKIKNLKSKLNSYLKKTLKFKQAFTNLNYLNYLLFNAFATLIISILINTRLTSLDRNPLNTINNTLGINLDNLNDLDTIINNQNIFYILVSPFILSLLLSIVFFLTTEVRNLNKINTTFFFYNLIFTFFLGLGIHNYFN